MEASFRNGLNLFINQTIFQIVLYFRGISLKTRTCQKFIKSNKRIHLNYEKLALHEICALNLISITGKLISVEKKNVN